MRKKCIHANRRKRGSYPHPMRERVDYKFKDESARNKAVKRHIHPRHMRILEQ